MGNNKNKIHRKKVYEKYLFSCNYCKRVFCVPECWDGKEAIHDGEMFLEIDHIKPTKLGGEDNIENKQALCSKCNRDKSDKFPYNYVKL